MISKSRTSLALGALVTGALLLAACAPAASAPTPTAPPPTAMPTLAPTNTSAAAAESIQVATDPKLGQYLVDAKGMALYLWKKDTTPGTSSCNGQCAQVWPPFVDSNPPAAGSGVTGTIALINRQDGSQQVTYSGDPLYFYAKDKNPGDVTGQGVGGVWFLVSPSGEAITAGVPTVQPTTTSSTPAASGASLQVASDPKLGKFLTDGKGLTLYIFKNDKPGVSNCSGGCAQVWPPLVASNLPAVGSDVTGTLALIQRADGSQQVTYNGMPLYYFQGDKQPGDTKGQGLNDVWFVAAP